MRGIDATNGRAIEGLDHLKQSIRDILTTPVGSRVMRRDYGSRLFQMTSAPMNQSTIVDLYAATADALRKWEPRIKVTNVKVTRAIPGAVDLELTGTYGAQTIAMTVTV